MASAGAGCTEPRARRSEADVTLERVAAGARAAVETTGSFPIGQVGPTPEPGCCAQDNRYRCRGNPAAWDDPVWRALGVRFEGEHRFVYEYLSDGRTFMAKAIGDLDCDDRAIRWVLTGTVDAKGQLTTQLTRPDPMQD
jgi:hypothetical protein